MEDYQPVSLQDTSVTESTIGMERRLRTGLRSGGGKRRRRSYGKSGAGGPYLMIALAAVYAMCIAGGKVYANWDSLNHRLETSTLHNEGSDVMTLHEVEGSSDLLSRETRGINDNCPNHDAWLKRTTYPREIFYYGENSLSTCNQRWFFWLYLIGALYMFLALAIICDDFFVPALEVIIFKTKLPEDVAGATFMAAGGSAPELFTSLCGIMFSGSVDVGIGTIVGSAVFNVLFVIAICAFGTYFGPTDQTKLHLTWYPFTRDVTFYSCGLLILVICFIDNVIQIWEACILLFWYFLYCMFMIVNGRFQAWAEGSMTKLKSKISPGKKEDDEFTKEEDLTVENQRGSEQGEREKTKSPEKSPEKKGEEHVEEKNSNEDKEEDKEGDDDDEDDDEPMDLSWPSGQGVWAVIKYLVQFPIKLLLMITVPDPKRGKPDEETGETDKSSRFWWWGYHLFFITFINSILWIGIYSFFMVWWVERMGFLFGIQSSVMGLTFLAAGTSIPDLITSYLVARKGFGDMALSSSIGSNLFDICIGLPIPWLIYFAIKVVLKVNVDSVGLGCYVLMLFGMLLAVFFLILIMRWELSLWMGIAMLVLYFAFLVVAILMGESIIPCVMD